MCVVCVCVYVCVCVALVAKTRRELQHVVEVLDEACTQWGMCISVNKTKIMQMRTEEHRPMDQGTGHHPARANPRGGAVLSVFRR